MNDTAGFTIEHVFELFVKGKAENMMRFIVGKTGLLATLRICQGPTNSVIAIFRDDEVQMDWLIASEDFASRN